MTNAHRCLTPGVHCPGHANVWLKCEDPVWASPCDRELRALLARQALEMNALRIQHLQALLTLAQRFNQRDNFVEYRRKLRELQSRRESICAE
jgi:hypothetical protein